MSNLTLNDFDDAVLALIEAKANQSGRPAKDIAKEALIKGLLWSPAERTSYADQVRAMSPARPAEDSTDIIRAMRDDA